MTSSCGFPWSPAALVAGAAGGEGLWDGGVIDTCGIALMHPMREGQSPQQIGRKGLSQIPPDLVAKSQPTDIIDIIL